MEGRCEPETRERYMIPRPYIAAWQDHAPWKSFSQVEQDLVISRTLVELFSDEFLRENLAFRGGTALHKLYLSPAPRYSEDIDLVQIKPGPIKPIMERINEVITFFDEPRSTNVKGHGAKALYRFTSEYEDIRLRLKLEINCKEHFNVLPWVDFTSMTHARDVNFRDSVPKMAFGKLVQQGEQWRMPLSIEVHHGLMDGLHVGQFIQVLQAMFDNPSQLD